MVINLISDIDISRNFALQKVRAYYHDQDILENEYASVGADGIQTFISVVFSKNRDLYVQFDGLPNTLIGGSGWNIEIKLPPEIEAIQPKVNLGFTSRGCNRSCGFCIVPQKEGKFHVVGDLLDLWDGASEKIMMWDNNILFDAEHFQKICKQAKDNGLIVDFNQGLDFRLFTEETIEALRGVRRDDKLRFALDHVSLIPLFQQKLELIKQAEYTPFVYVYCDGTDWEGTLSRLNFLRNNGCKAYLQRDDCVRSNENYTILAEWCNGILGHFFTTDFDTFYQANMERRNRTMQQSGGYMRNVEVAEIKLGNSRRPLGDLTGLMDSIQVAGLLNPITLTKDKTLIAGAHRLEACRQLGWNTIPAIILDISTEHAELAEIDENLIRNELGAMEHAEQMKRRKVLYEIVYPESTKAFKVRSNLKSAQSETVSFSADTAKKIGCTPRSIQLDVQIATNIPQGIRDAIRNTPLANNKRELIALARKSEAEQKQFLDSMGNGIEKPERIPADCEQCQYFLNRSEEQRQ